MKKDTVLILDFGAGSNQLTARRVRELGVYSEVMPAGTPAEKIAAANYKGIILTGSDSETEQKISELNIPVKVFIESPGSEPDIDMLKGFIFDTCGCSADWTIPGFIEDAVDKIRAEAKGGRVLCALSGGVDSSVCAALVHKAVGDRLNCIFVDHGLMRKNEGDEVEQVFAEQFSIKLKRVNAGERFLAKLKGVTDPEMKRKIIGEEFIRVFEEQAAKLGGAEYLVQGTIYPDIIESGQDGEGVVKSHHNVGGLPETIGFTGLIEPLRDLFKDEVRKVGLQLGLPEFLAMRQPFPGPGNGIRVIGEVTEQKLSILREADAIFREEITKAGLHKSIGQYFAVITDIRSVGVAGGERTYDYTVALRAVTTTDFMTAKWAKIPYELLEIVSERIVNEVPNIGRVVYDITSKPPGTIEWE